MSLYATLVLAFAMSMDAFAAAVGKGAVLHRPSIKEAIRTGLIFGTIEALTPLFGWTIGLAASQFVMSWDHWLAFVLLVVLGGRMMLSGLHRPQQEKQQRLKRHGFLMLAATAVATSLDAMAVGVGLAFLKVNIMLTALTIGAVTSVMAAAGILLGRVIGPVMGRWAEMAGGLTLIGIGGSILAEHLKLFN